MTLASFPPPLISLLYDLRSYEFTLGISDYMALQQALSAGLGVGSRGELIYLCQTLWGKSPVEQEQIRRILESALPAKLTTAEIERLAGERAETPSTDQEPVLDRQRPNGPETENRHPTGTESPSQPGDATSGQSHSTKPAPRLPAWALSLGKRDGGYVVSAPADELPADIEVCRGFDFDGRLPIPLRQIQRTWSYLRRMQPEGPSVVLDAEATIEEIYRKGVLEVPVMVPRRVNRAKLLILKDESNDMAPFSRVILPLIEAAESSGLSEVNVLYFRSVLSQSLFDDPTLTASVDVTQLRNRLRGASLLVISDGGSARKREVNDRWVRRTCQFLSDTREFWPNRTWLNPTPSNRWRNTSAQAIQQRAPIAMYSYDRLGFNAAVERLRGKLALLHNE